MVRPLVLLIWVTACAGPTEPRSRPPAPAPSVALDDAAPPRGPNEPRERGPSEPSISEAHARQLVTERLRRAGLRVLFDVEVEVGERRVTLDGYDPTRRIGFEYTAPSERAQNGPPPVAGSEVRILWLPPGTESEVERATDAFVTRYLSADAGPR